MAGGKADNSGCFGIIALVVVIGLLSMIPTGVWIGLGVIAAVAVVVWIGFAVAGAVHEHRKRKEAAAQQRRRAEAAAVKRQRIADLGAQNAHRVEAALLSVKRITDSAAAREGWLGDVDFTADLDGLVDGFARAHDLRKVAAELGELDAPSTEDRSAEDRRILTDARTAADALETASVERVRLIHRCAEEACSIDDSLQQERRDAQTAEQRARLHGELNAMLYGAATESSAPVADSAADRVMARVDGYREIKQQIVKARDIGA